MPGAFGVKPFEVTGTLTQLIEEARPREIVFTKMIHIGHGVKKPHQQMASVAGSELWERLEQMKLPAKVVMTMELTPAMRNRLVDIHLAGRR